MPSPPAPIPVVDAAAEAETPEAASATDATPALPTEPDAGETDAAAAQCPQGMALVAGSYCPEVAHQCLGYLDPPGRFHEYRCREYARSPTCKTDRVALQFCIDVREYTPKGQALPAHFVSFDAASLACQEAGKRLCREREWNFACEGEALLPYPYGFARDSSACHADRTDILEDGGRRVTDRRVPSGQFPRCASPFGVLDLAGNLEEFVALDDSDPPRPVMKGDWWHPGRHHCRARQTFHNASYSGVETGFRCCADVPATIQ